MVTGLAIACALGHVLALGALGIHMLALVLVERRNREDKRP